MIKFGTSGFRGVIGDNWTKENIQKIAFGLRQIIESQSKSAKIVIGYDNRFLGHQSATWFCEAVCTDKIHVTFLGDSVPSPVIAFKAVTYDYGIMITASHNPFIYNGIKIFLHGGTEAGDEFCAELMSNINNLKKYETTPINKLFFEDKTAEVSTDTDDYVNKVASIIDTRMTGLSGLKILVNPMHGSSTTVVKKLLEKMGINYDLINENVDPYFGGKLPAPYPYNLESMVNVLKAGKYDLGFALDGDGDRIAVIDRNGKFYDCNFLSAIICYYFISIKKNTNCGAVKSIFTSNLVAKLCTHFGFKVTETPVGFKFLGAELAKRNDAVLATEASGIAFKEISYAKDAIVILAILIDLIANIKKDVGELIAELSELVNFPSSYMEFAYPFEAHERTQVIERITKSTPNSLANVIKQEVFADGFKLHFLGDYWCAIRLSGTENVLRIYTEMQTESDCLDVIQKFEAFYNLGQRQK